MKAQVALRNPAVRLANWMPWNVAWSSRGIVFARQRIEFCP